MASLVITRDELRSELGFHAGWGRSSSDWDDDQEQTIDAAIKGGLRRFMLHALIPGTKKSYEWSFLYQHFLFSTVEDRTSYDLPSDFGTPVGPLLFNETSTSYSPAPIVNEAMLREMKSKCPQETGVPRWAAIHAKEVTATDQMHALMVFPDPDGEYAMRLGYRVQPEMLTETMTRLPGGAAHALTIKYACLAEMGRILDDLRDYEPDYQEALTASISYDGRMDSGFLGINLDPGIGMTEGRYINPSAYTITIDGLTEASL